MRQNLRKLLFISSFNNEKLLISVSRNLRGHTFVPTSLIKIRIYLYNIIPKHYSMPSFLQNISQASIKSFTKRSIFYSSVKTNHNSKDTPRVVLIPNPGDKEKKNNHEKFDEWLAGLIDGDGCFQLSKKRVY